MVHATQANDSYHSSQVVNPTSKGCHHPDHHKADTQKISWSAAVITVSDRSAAGVREDSSGPALVDFLTAHGYQVLETAIVPDDQDQIAQALIAAADKNIALVVTTGGTGFSPRDVTPEATQAVCERMAPGIGELMRAASMLITPRGCLSRATAGIRGKTLIVNVPGSPKSATENLEAVIDPLAHGLKMLRGGQANCAELPNNEI